MVSVSLKNTEKFKETMKNISYKKIGSISKNDKFIIKDMNNKEVINTNIKKLFTTYHSFSNQMK